MGKKNIPIVRTRYVQMAIGIATEIVKLLRKYWHAWCFSRAYFGKLRPDGHILDLLVYGNVLGISSTFKQAKLNTGGAL